MVTFWLRTCTLDETEEMAEIVDATIMEAVHAATGIDFNADDVAKDTLRLPARLKGEGLRIMTNLRRPAFLGAILDILPRCIGRKGPNEKLAKRVYIKQLTNAVGREAYGAEGHRNAGFLQADNLGPFPTAMHNAWQYTRLEAGHNHGLTLASSPEEWGRLGPLAEPTAARNREASERKKSRATQGTEDMTNMVPNREPRGDVEERAIETGGTMPKEPMNNTTQEWQEVTAEVMDDMDEEEEGRRVAEHEAQNNDMEDNSRTRARG